MFGGDNIKRKSGEGDGGWCSTIDRRSISLGLWKASKRWDKLVSMGNEGKGKVTT